MTKLAPESKLLLTKKGEGTGVQIKPSGVMKSNVNNPAAAASNDMLLDVCCAQPLRSVPLVSSSRSGTAVIPWEGNGTDYHTVGSPLKGGSATEMVNKGGGPNGITPTVPLTVGRTKDIAKNFEKLTAPGKQGESKEDKGKNGENSTLQGTLPTNNPQRNKTGPGPAGLGTEASGLKISMADTVRNAEAVGRGRDPVTFQPNKMKKLGTVGLSAGRPAIVFSGEDAKYLADKMDFTIVGKFSHSIPSTSQIQRAIDGMKLVGEFNWKYINAKHIALQVEDPNDYAKLLIGQNGMPVWYVDHHPMRVFKWTPDFDPFFETPIAAVWCNITGLPILLFEKSALFAIGKLLGNPIQLDYAMATQTRLSFARICVEIDISKPTVEEFVLDILGKESVQRVVWDKIPYIVEIVIMWDM